jgi:hypothetical protein
MQMGISMKKLLAASALVFGAAISSPANAGPITEQFDFTVPTLQAGAPISPVTGSFTVTFDPLVDSGSFTSAGLVVNSLNLPVLPVGFQYFAGPINGGTMVFGGTVNGSNDALGTDDFILTILQAASLTPSATFFQYTTANGLGFNAVGAINLKVTPVVAAVPEPFTMSMFAAGLLGLGASRRRRLSRVSDANQIQTRRSFS